MCDEDIAFGARARWFDDTLILTLKCVVADLAVIPATHLEPLQKALLVHVSSSPLAPTKRLPPGLQAYPARHFDISSRVNSATNSFFVVYRVRPALARSFGNLFVALDAEHLIGGTDLNTP